MDLANLEIVITSKGGEAALNQLEKLGTTADTAEESVSKLSASFSASGGISYNILEIGYAAKDAASGVKELTSSLNAIGVNKLTDLVRATKEIATATDIANKSRSVSAKTFADEEVAIGKAIVAENSAKKSVVDLTIAEEKLALAQENTVSATTKRATASKALETEQSRSITAANNALKSTQDLNDEHEKAPAKIEKHTQSWREHILVVSGGIIVYQGIRKALNYITDFFAGGIKAVSDYEDSIINVAAMLTTLSVDQSNIPKTFQSSVQYAEQLIPVLQKIDASSVMNLNELTQMTEAFIRQGVVLNINNQDQIQGYTNISNALKFVTQGQSSSRQIAQEIKAVVEGTSKSSDALSLVLNAQLNGQLKPMIAAWREHGKAIGDSGYLIQKVGEALTGYTAAYEKMQGSWTVIKSSLETTWQVLERDVFTPLLQDWKNGLKEVDNWLKTNSNTIVTVVQNSWLILSGAVNLVTQNAGLLKIALEAAFGWEVLKLVNGVTVLLTSLPVLFEGAAVACASAGVTMTGALLGTMGTIGLMVFAIDQVIKRWETFSNSYKLIKATFSGDVSFMEAATAGPAEAASILDKINRTKVVAKDANGNKYTQAAIDNTAWADNSIIGSGLLNLKIPTGDGKTTKGGTENFTEFNALADEINKVNEAQSKLSDSSLTLAESDATLSKAQADYNAKLTLAEALHKANLSKSDETLADKNNEKTATDALKDSYKVYTDELSVNTKIKKQVTEEDKTAQKALDELTKTLGLYRDAYMPLDTAVNLATVAQENLTNSNQDLEDAFKAQKQAIAEYGLGTVEAKTATENYELALKHNIASTIIATDSDIDLKASKKGVADEATKANKRISDFNATLSEYGTAAGLSSTLTKVLEDQFKSLNKVGSDTDSTFLKLSTTLTSIGTILGGRLGTALSDIGKGLTGLNAPAIKNADGTINQQATDNQTALSYGAIGNGIGQAIGGKTGNAISTASSFAATGFMVAGPYGAVVGGALGLISSIFGGSGRDTTTLDNTNTSSRQSIEQLATSGSAIAMQIMAAAGYTDSGLKELRTTSTGVSAIGLPSSLTGGSQTSLFDNDWTGKKGQDLVQYIQNLTLIDTALKSMSSATIVTTLEQISYKWDAIISQIGDSADVQKAKLNEQITAITGISAQSVGTMIEGVITSTPTGQAGAAFAAKMEESIATAVRGMVISQTITGAIMPALQAAISPLVTALITNPSGENISGLIQNVNSAITGLSPVINSLQTALDGLGVAGNESTTTLTGATAAATHTITDFSGTLTSSLNSAFSNGIDAVTQFQADFSSSIKSALLSSIESSFSTAILSPALQPIYDAMGSAFSGGVVNPSILTEILANAESTLVNLSPAVKSLFDTLGNTGMFSSSATTSASASATATAPATESLQSQIDAAVKTATESLTKQVTDLQAQIDKATSDAQTASSKAATEAQTAWQSAIAPLLDYQKTLFTSSSTSAMSGQGLLYAQQSVVDRLVEEALSGTQDVRINAVGKMSNAISDVLTTARNITTDPLEYARIVARESNSITNVANPDATNADVRDAIIDLKGVIEEGQKTVETINYAIRDFQINGIKTI